MLDLAKLVDDLSTLTVIEAAELSKMLEEKWGVSAAAPVAAAALAGGAAAPAAEAAAEKTEFDVILAAILLTPSLTGLGAASTRSLASLRPRLVIARTSLITLIFFSPE